jgi:N-methylhydantoinase A/oxoprolinase/acetone carboxylase beta subunit
VIAALDAVGIDLANVQLVTHSTTITTNALVTRQFPTAALITTEGFRDVIEIRRRYPGRSLGHLTRRGQALHPAPRPP